MENRKSNGLKPCKVEVDQNGCVDAGKNEWYADLKSLCLSYLDISIPQYAKQSHANLRLVRRDLDNKYECAGGELCEEFVKSKIKQILKGERKRYKDLWDSLGDRSMDAPCPEDVDTAVWDRLKTYWTSEAGVAKSNQMQEARAKVVNLNLTGRAGYHKLAEEKGCSPTLKEARVRAYTPRSTDESVRTSSKV
ncbi:hypothetical protein R1sor_016499 [Riccia sorocarpa]|uniref:Uncharacterized protein n=1 Tax=Riccia sorocarpa TaxID=122646 RepID=A0ABD3HIP5_9MARC